MLYSLYDHRDSGGYLHNLQEAIDGDPYNQIPSVVSTWFLYQKVYE
jgi:hypothetical protein